MFILATGHALTATHVASGYSKRTYVVKGDLSHVRDRDLINALGNIGLGGHVRRINNDSQATVDIYTD